MWGSRCFSVASKRKTFRCKGLNSGKTHFSTFLQYAIHPSLDLCEFRICDFANMRQRNSPIYSLYARKFRCYAILCSGAQSGWTLPHLLLSRHNLCATFSATMWRTHCGGMGHVGVVVVYKRKDHLVSQ
jgi:hypothetical protein